MKNLKEKLFHTFIILFVLSLLCFSCNDDDGSFDSSGSLQLEITDAPIDNAEVSGAFVTIADIMIDGESFTGFQGKQTIDILAYQNGDIKSLGQANVESKAYSEITLVLDYDQDENGNSPGCYILTDDNQKIDLMASNNASNEINLSTLFTVDTDTESELVIDFDLRKSIKEESNTSSNYTFVTTNELNTSLRLVAKNNSAKITGTCENWENHTDKAIVYAYKKGTFNASSETTGQGASNIEFKNATTSAVVKADGSFQLNFLAADDYELYFIGYDDNNNDGKFEANGVLTTSVIGSIDLLGISLNANVDITANIQIIGITPF